MTAGPFQFKSDYARRLKAEGRAEGEARGMAKGLLAILDGRGFEVSDEVRSRVMACSDLDQLKTWVRRAAVVRTIDEVFE
jgi:hypothetical protein